jgi:NAD+ synthase
MQGLELSQEDLVKCENRIEEAILKMVQSSNSSGAVIGLSGGVDSALVATLASRAVDVYGLIMPDTSSNNVEDIEDAKSLAESIGIDYEVIGIESMVKEFYDHRPRIGPAECRLAYSNVKSRVRMTLAYFTANLSGRIVLGTGNKTELMMGYFTKYGDGGVDILPIADLYKTRVWQMAKHVGVPDRIVKKAPSAGLWAGQTDEEELGVKYADVDKVLYAMFDKDMQIDAILKETGVERETVEKLLNLIKNSEHKRNMPPIVHLEAG